MPHETAAVSAQVLCTPYNHAPCHFMQSHIRKVYACLTATCHLHFWQTDWDLLHATAATRGWNRYQNKSQHRKSTLEKEFLALLLQGFKPMIFQLQVRCSNHWAIPAHTQRCTILSISLSPKSVLLQQLVQSISGLNDRLSGVHYYLMTDNLTLSFVRHTRWMPFSMRMLSAEATLCITVWKQWKYPS